VDCAVNDALAKNKQISIDHRIIISGGATRYVHTEAKVIDDKTGRPLWVTGTVQNITERKLQEEQIRELAYFDSLTGLPNRVLFKENLGQVLARAKDNSLKVAMMFLDMDHFKEVNDTMGHDVGDKLLQGFAGRLTKCVRKCDRSPGLLPRNSDCLARLGGDEFTVILGDISQTEDAAAVAKRIVNTMAVPFELGDSQASVTVSIGISIYPDDGTEVGDLLKAADIAMYQAKEQGRNQFFFYSATP
jgi:diguanylate cyclase (GGDEF)-like protein